MERREVLLWMGHFSLSSVETTSLVYSVLPTMRQGVVILKRVGMSWDGRGHALSGGEHRSTIVSVSMSDFAFGIHLSRGVSKFRFSFT